MLVLRLALALGLALAVGEAVAMAAATSEEKANAPVALELQLVQNVNLYLLEAELGLSEPFDKGPGQVASAEQLEAAQAIERALVDIRRELEQLDGAEMKEMAQLDDRFKTLLASGADLAEGRQLIAFLETLTSASCDQVSMDHLRRVANFYDGVAAKGGGVVQNYAKLRVLQCWQQFRGSLATRVERTLGKMVAPIFQLVEQLARKMRSQSAPPLANGKAAQARRAAGAIKIEEPVAPRERLLAESSLEAGPEGAGRLAEAVAAMKAVKFNTDEARRKFALAVKGLYPAHFAQLEDQQSVTTSRLLDFYRLHFEMPCAELTERFSSAIVKPAEMFKGFWGKTVGQTLASAKQSDPRLDYQLQVYRICKLASQTSAAIRVYF